MSAKKTNAFWVVGNVAFIDVSTKKHPNTFATVDTLDIPVVINGRGRWHACVTYTVDVETIRVQRAAYRADGIRTSELMHVVIIGPVDGKWVDHKSRDGLDNRRGNLRECTPQQNAGNRIKKRKCANEFKGISRSRGRWTAEIRISGKHIHIGQYSSPEEAARAYDAAAILHFGEFARTNFGATAT